MGYFVSEEDGVEGVDFVSEPDPLVLSPDEAFVSLDSLLLADPFDFEPLSLA